MELYECDRAIDVARQKICELRKELSGLEGFSSEVTKGSGEFSSQLARKRFLAEKMKSMRNNRTAHGVGKLLEETMRPLSTCHEFNAIQRDVQRAIEEVLEEIARYERLISQYERERARIIERKRAEADAAAKKMADG